MQHPENTFSPLLIDEQIEHPISSLPRGEVHLVHDLQSMYDQDNHDAINRVWERLASQRQHPYSPSTLPQPQQGPENISPFREREGYLRQRKGEPRQAHAFTRRLSLLAAVLFVTLLVGSLAFVFTLLRPGTSVGLPITPASPSGWGKIVHIQTMPDAGFNGLAWSPDGQRVAASNRMSTTNVVRIWDAATGQHMVTVQAGAFVNTLAWSPTGQQVAIVTNRNISIVDGQSGKVLRTLPTSDQPLFSSAASGGTLLSSRFPASGGAAFRNLAWSPDGSQIAVSLFGDAAASPGLLVWNVQTGATQHLPLKSGYNTWGGVSWSSNGEYLAADIAQTAYTDPLSQSGIIVWKVATRQVVLQKNTGSVPDINVTLAWQPGTLNVAQIGVVKTGNSYASTIFLVDGITGKILNHLTVPVSDVLTWSPDGKYLAYTSPADVDNGNTAQILDASTWKVVYTYQDEKNIINELAWSPDGHSIATGETVIQGNAWLGVVRVWTAQG